MTAHEPVVRAHQRDAFSHPSGWYMSCRCGYCGPQRREPTLAQADGEAHLRAVRRARRGT